ncbi:MAG: anti-sigma28 factor (negative regulator of flagellin synthesis) [Candidatus Latescibacterota bacterium]|jgi:anti-sigma28 factor (negative regulator of flagellin synthesis)
MVFFLYKSLKIIMLMSIYMIEVNAMRIENAINEVQGPQQTERRQNAEMRRKRNIGGSGDVVEISTASRSLGAQAASTVDLNAVSDVRQSRVEAVKQRVASGYYDQPEVRVAIADAVLNAGVVDAVAQEIQDVRSTRRELGSVPDVREDRVAQARDRVASGFYDAGGVNAQVADRILDNLIG